MPGPSAILSKWAFFARGPSGTTPDAESGTARHEAARGADRDQVDPSRALRLAIRSPGWPKPFTIEVPDLDLRIVWANPRQPAKIEGVELRPF